VGCFAALISFQEFGGEGGVAHEVVERAEAAGIVREDIIIERLALTVGTDTNSGLIVIEAVQRIKAELSEPDSGSQQCVFWLA